MTRKRRLVSVAFPVLLAAAFAVLPATASSGTGLGSGVGTLPQGLQSNDSFLASFAANHVSNVFATSDNLLSCYRPEVTASYNDGTPLPNGPSDGYTGESVCPGAGTGEDIGLTPYPSQTGSTPGFPALSPMLVKDRSESDIRVDPTNSQHIIGSSKWFVDAEGYNHVLGFYESFDGGKTFAAQGHIPGYEGWTDDTDPVGAFDGDGNYYELILPYQFVYTKSGGHNFSPGQQPNPIIPNEAVSIAVRKNGLTGVQDWITTHKNSAGITGIDFVTTTDASFGQEPDKQWITIDTNRFLRDRVTPNPNYDTVYAMWVIFNGFNSKPFVATAKAMPDGTHTDWTAPIALPDPQGTNSNTYLLPHVAPDGTVYTSITNFPGQKGKCCVTFGVDFSKDGGQTWQATPSTINNIIVTPNYANTTFRTGIENTFAVGNHLSATGHYPLYIAYEDFSAGITNVILAASDDGGATWSFRQVNDNVVTATSPPADELQPNLAVADNGTVSVNFYDRRIACPAAGSSEAAAAGLALDQVNPNYSGSLPPYGATNYCIYAAIQFYTADLTPIGRNIRLQEHAWDPQLNSPHWLSPNLSGAGDTFIGDYFGNTFGGSISYSTFVSTSNDGSNSSHYQQQVVATLTIPGSVPSGRPNR